MAPEMLLSGRPTTNVGHRQRTRGPRIGLFGGFATSITFGESGSPKGSVEPERAPMLTQSGPLGTHWRSLKPLVALQQSAGRSE